MRTILGGSVALFMHAYNRFGATAQTASPGRHSGDKYLPPFPFRNSLILIAGVLNHVQ